MKEEGSAIGCLENSFMMIIDNSTVAFNNNRAQTGGALYFNQESNFIIDDFALVMFNNNTAMLGGALACY